MKGLGYSMSNDPFLGSASGSFSTLHSVNPATKQRSYSISAVYEPSKIYENLVVLTGAHVNNILFGREG
jgi:hypothetical protein